MAFRVKPNPRGPFRRIIGGFNCSASEPISRLGEVSRELVLEPPEEVATRLTLRAGDSSDIIKDKPEAEADFMTVLDRLEAGCRRGDTEGIVIFADIGNPEFELIGMSDSLRNGFLSSEWTKLSLSGGNSL